MSPRNQLLAACMIFALSAASPAQSGFDPVGGLGTATDGKNQVTETTYTVVPGDTLYGIALRFYGDGFRWPEIFAANRALIDNPDLIFPGQLFRIPAGEKRELPSKGDYTVAEGDTLSSISQKLFGTPDRWQEIYAANADRIQDASNLEAGTVLRIPAGASTGPAGPSSKPEKDRPNEQRPNVPGNPRLEDLAHQGGVTTRSPEFSKWASEALDIAQGWNFPTLTNKYGDTITRADYLRAILYIESGGVHSQPGGRVTQSGAGALGFMQLMPGTAAGLHVDPRDPHGNLIGGARYITETMKGPNTTNGGDGPADRLIKAAAGYNRGPYATELRDKSWDVYVRTSSSTESVQYGILTRMCLGLRLSADETQWIMTHRHLSAAGVDDLAQTYFKGSHALF